MNPDANLVARTALIQACHRVGREVPRWTQGAGGNVSIKDGDNLWIKASGCRLDAVGPPTTMARLPLQAFVQTLQAELRHSLDGEGAYATALATMGDPAYGRASMESAFHALLPRRLVVHFHALSALVMAHVAHTEPERWGEFCRTHQFVPPARLGPTRPGLLLSFAVGEQPSFEVCLLANHGVILQADDAAVISRWAKFERAFCDAWVMRHLAAQGDDMPLQAYERGPWKVFFPDAAVFADRIRAITSPTDASPPGTLAIAADALHRDRDATELWIATQVLRRVCPDLQELPEAIAAALVDLPTEAWRRAQSPYAVTQ